ncbi:MAG: hypothetical protein FWD39_00605 [Clostridiales bacterium]|nr:hypothetical protein [Clostridiales bacterium]
MKTNKLLLILLAVMLCAALLVTASCGGKAASLCADCSEDPCVCPEKPWDGAWQGKGTADDPLQVSKAEQLAKIAELVNAGKLEQTIFMAAYGCSETEAARAVLEEGFTVHIKIMNDIDLSGYATGKGWTPIGTYTKPFVGVFDGNNKTIARLTINDPDLDDVGLFGHIINGEVKNLCVANANVTGKDFVGGLVGLASGLSMTNCSFEGRVNGEDYVGGIVGFATLSTILENCSSAGAVNGNLGVGGVTGVLDGGILWPCKLISCSSSSTVTGSGEFVGGLAGTVESFAEVTGCRATGNVTGKNYTGGLVGCVDGGRVKTSYATGNVSGENKVGGVVGSLLNGLPERLGSTTNNARMENCYATGNVTGKDFVGGVAGSIESWAWAVSCYAAGSVSGDNYVGGVVGTLSFQLFKETSSGLIVAHNVLFGGAENCVAFNPSVTATGSNAGRVSGSAGQLFYNELNWAFSEDELHNSAAFSGMTVTVGGEAKTPDAGERRPDGAELSAEAILANGTFGGRFTTEGGWTTANGKLPGFGATVNLPGHIEAVLLAHIK